MTNRKIFDLKFIEQFQRNDKHSFDVIYKCYQEYIYLLAYNFCLDKDKAYKIMESTFIQIYQSINKLRDPNDFYIWSANICYSNCLKEIGDKSQVCSSNDEVDYHHGQDTSVIAIQREQVKEIVLKEIELLSPQARTIAYLRFFEELSYLTISKITSLSQELIVQNIKQLEAKLQTTLKRRGFTSLACLSLVLSPNLIAYFKLLVELSEPLSMAASSALLSRVKKYKIAKKDQMNSTWKLSSYGFIGLVILLPLSVFAMDREDVSLILEDGGRNASIKEVVYPSGLTNKSYKIKVDISNNNFDQILLNSSDDLIVNSNGNYRISLMRKGKEIDFKDIVINNIDRESPFVINKKVSKGVLIFQLDDKDSQVDFEGVEFYEDGIISNNIEINETTQEVYIYNRDGTTGVLKVPNIAGNVLDIKIATYELYS